MYKYYKKDNYFVMEYSFDSVTEFIDYLDNKPINTDVWGCSDLASEIGSYNFCKTKTLDEAKKLCKYGYHENFDKLMNLKLKLEKYINVSNNKGRQYNYYVGYVPDVKAYLEGNPLSMFNFNKQKNKGKNINIYYNVAVSYNISINEIYTRGAITLSLIEMLERLGFNVGLSIFSMSKDYDQIHYAKFNLKKWDERLNIQKLYFPLCHPSFLRRLVFRLKEQTPDITVRWINGYGSPCEEYTIKKIIALRENDIVICTPQEMGIKGEDIIDDANRMFDYINKFVSEDVKLEHIKRLGK